MYPHPPFKTLHPRHHYYDLLKLECCIKSAGRPNICMAESQNPLNWCHLRMPLTQLFPVTSTNDERRQIHVTVPLVLHGLQWRRLHYKDRCHYLTSLPRLSVCVRENERETLQEECVCKRISAYKLHCASPGCVHHGEL